MDKRFEPLATGEVLSVDESVQILIGHRTFRVSELADAIKTQLEYGIQGWTQEKDGWFSEEGIPCEVLRFTANGWQKGKVRINLEFCPLDSEEYGKQAVASFDNEFAVPDSPAKMSDEIDFDASPVSMPDEFDLDASGASVAALALEDSFTSTQDEFDVETSLASNQALEEQEPNTIYVEMVQEVTTTISYDEFDVAEGMQSSLDEEFGMVDPMSTSLDDEFDVAEGMQSSLVEEFGMADPISTSLDDEDDEFGMADLMSTSLDDEFDVAEGMSTSLDDEFGVAEGMSTSLDDEFGMAEGMSTSLDDEFGITDPMQSSLDDEFDQISESIEQELELVESPQASSDEFLDLGGMSPDNDDELDFGEMSLDSDENLDFGETSASGEGEFQFEEISFNSDLEDDGTDSLLDDVWQDINQPSWQNNQ